MVLIWFRQLSTQEYTQVLAVTYHAYHYYAESAISGARHLMGVLAHPDLQPVLSKARSRVRGPLSDALVRYV